MRGGTGTEGRDGRLADVVAHHPLRGDRAMKHVRVRALETYLVGCGGRRLVLAVLGWLVLGWLVLGCAFIRHLGQMELRDGGEA